MVAGCGPVEKSAGREARRPPRPAFSYGLFSTHFKARKAASIFAAAVQPLSSGVPAPRNPGSIWPGWISA